MAVMSSSSFNDFSNSFPFNAFALGSLPFSAFAVGSLPFKVFSSSFASAFHTHTDESADLGVN